MADEGTVDFPLSNDDQARFKKLFAHVKDWCVEHQWAVGVAEMALGGFLIYHGIQSGLLVMGTDVVATVLDVDLTPREIGAAAGAALGTVPGAILGGIGLAGAFGAVGIPALALMAGGAALAALAGYGAGDLYARFTAPAPEMVDFLPAASLALLGTALLLDGARRIASDAKVRRLVSDFKDNVVHLARLARIEVIGTLTGLEQYLQEDLAPRLKEALNDPKVLGTAGAASMVAAGVVGSQALGAGSVAVLGSNTLGAVGVSLGLASAPLWPVLAGVGLAAAGGILLYRAMRAQPEPEGRSVILLPYNPSKD